MATPGDRDNPDLDQPLATVEYSPASGDPPYLAIVGDPLLTFQTGGVVVFRFAGQWTEILRRNCVPVETMLLVAESFLATGELPQWIGWEEV